MSFSSQHTRRDFMKSTAAVTAGAAMASSFISRSAFAAGNDETIKIALIGCGGRGSGACSQALSTTQGPVKLIAVADAFEDKARDALNNLKKEHADKVDVKPENIFWGFDAYQKAIDSGADLIVIATPPGFRPIHFEYAVKQGKNIFAEKPVATDAAGIRRFLAAVKEAKAKNLKVGIGLQRHHQAGYIETVKRIHDGELGDLRLLRVYWNDAGVWVRQRQEYAERKQKAGEGPLTEMEYQMRNWYYFVWLCGDHITEQHIHNLDVANWVLKGHPVEARGMGGRLVRTGIDNGEIYDHHAVQFTYADGTMVASECRHHPGAWNSVSEHAHGTKGFADIGGGRFFEPGLNGKETGRAKQSRDNPYQVEHDDLQHAIRNNLEYNEGEYGAHSTFTSILGRMCTYSGQTIKWDDAIEAQVSVMPEKYDWNANPPSLPDKDGRYSIAKPGQSNNDTVWGRANKEIIEWTKKKR
ncbi:MAG TPA: Gfo/Idh/MocA family oxidoreductase [Tepidisphaeraceae bacterium]|nr:Gfo/Idh/MocA family oxidoreductase [Tepidisphaeraceae bacterium]